MNMKDFGVGQFVILRTYSAGVHVGTLVCRDGREARLAAGARRVWRWRGANTLTELAKNGPVLSDYTRISEGSPGEVLLTEVVEVILVSEQARTKLDQSVWN